MRLNNLLKISAVFLGVSIIFQLISPAILLAQSPDPNLQQMASLISSLQGILNSLKAKVHALKGGSTIQTAQAQTADITTGLIGHWKFDESSGTTAADSSGNTNTGTLTNGPTWTTGKIGGAVNLDGTNDYVDIPGIQNMVGGTTQASISAWVYKNTSSDQSGGIGFGNTLGNYRFNFLWDNDGRVYFQVENGAASYPSISLPGSGWHHITMAYNGSLTNKITPYVDGVAQPPLSSTTAQIASAANLRNFVIGFDKDNAYTSGIVDDVRIYNRALSASEVQTIYSIGSGGTPPPSDTIYPAVSITAPASGSTVSGSSITVSANASDNVGVVGVQFKLDGSSLGNEDTVSPYSVIWNSTTASNGSHTLTATARDAVGNQTTSSGVPVTINNTAPLTDTQAPSTPTTLSATAQSSSQINLSWTASTDNVGVTGYRVEHCQGSSCTNFVQVGTPGTNSYNDTGLSANTTYRYQVRAVDAAGNLSSYSSIASATTQTAPTGTALGNLAASMAPGTWAQLNTNGFNSGAVLRPPNGGSILEYTDKAGSWNPLNNTILVLGGAHGGPTTGCLGTLFALYTDSSNNWTNSNTNQPPSPCPNFDDAFVGSSPGTGGGIGHDYHHDTIVPATGDYYHRQYGSGKVMKFSHATQSWSQCSQWNPGGSHQVAGALEYFPERNSLVFLDGDNGVWELSLAGGNCLGTWVWRAAGNNGGLSPQLTGIGPYHNQSRYSSRCQCVVLGGGNGSRKLSRYNSNGTFSPATDASFTVKISADGSGDVFTIDPVTGYMLFWEYSTGQNTMYQYDPLANTWTTISRSAPLFPSVDGGTERTIAVPISTYGVIMFVQVGSSSGGSVYLYKHSPGGGTPPPSDTTVPTASVTAPTAGTTVVNTVTISANASDNVGVTNVEFLVDGVVKGSDSSSPYLYSWDTTNGGAHACNGAHTHTLIARAYDAAGNIGTSASIVVNMNNPSYCTTPPPSTKFVIGDRVQVSSGPLNVRLTPSTSGTLLGTQATNVLGTVTGGPTAADGYNWWNINFDVGVDGWAVEDFLVKYTTTPLPTGDFATRCSAAGVIKCVDFDDAADIAGRWGNISGILPGSGGSPAIDTAIKASGVGSLKFTVPGSVGNVAGSYFTNFSDDLSQLFGEGEEFYIQWRQRISPEYLTTSFTSSGPGGWKQAIIGEGDRAGVCNPASPSSATCPTSCSQLEIVAQSQGWGRNIYGGYHSCGGKDGQYEGFEYWDSTLGQITVQNAVGCLYGSGYPQPPCVGYKSNQWMTFQMQVKIGTWYKNDGNYRQDSTVRMWSAEEGQPSRLVIDFSPGVHGYDLANTSPATAKYGKIWLLPYQTDKSASVAHPTAYMWYDDLIISRNKIPDPGSGTPPSTLTGDLNNDRTVNALDWSIMNAQWNTNNPQSDINADGIVNSIDFSLLNQNWGKTI